VTALLASVTSAAEASIAFDHGADVIDCKDPAAGALGALPHRTVAAIVTAIAGRAPVSATIGDLPMVPSALARHVSVMADTGVDYVKVGFFGPAGLAECARAVGATGVPAVAVLIADAFPPGWPLRPCLRALASARFAGAMLDTGNKSTGGLRAAMTPERLAAFVAEARAAGLFTGLAGGLSRADVPLLLPLGPDLLGFRTALCGPAGRASAIDAASVAALRATVGVRGPDATPIRARQAVPVSFTAGFEVE
jgi:(5-formylfuran-3-yl)methyl phosphate synthase